MVKVEVWRLERGPDLPGRRAAGRCRKRADLDHYKKTFFRPSKNHGFFALFENRQKTLVSVNEDGPSVKVAFFVFLPKQVKNRVEINIVSNLP